MKEISIDKYYILTVFLTWLIRCKYDSIYKVKLLNYHLLNLLSLV